MTAFKVNNVKKHGNLCQKSWLLIFIVRFFVNANFGLKIGAYCGSGGSKRSIELRAAGKRINGISLKFLKILVFGSDL